MKVSVALLAGGRSSRMGCCKSTLEIEGEPLLIRNIRLLKTRFEEILVSVPRQGLSMTLPEGIRLVTDPVDFEGPLTGIEVVLAAATSLKCLVLAGDIPLMDLSPVEALLAFASDGDITVANFNGEQDEPLFGIYDRNVLSRIRLLRESGERSVLRLLEACRIERKILEKPWWMMNLNTPGDYHQFTERLEQWRKKEMQ